MMNYSEFVRSLSDDQPPAGLTPLLKALWFDGKGNWDESHNVAEYIHEKNGSWIHAYLHRKEGDISNARYWYSMASQPVCKDSLEEEWQALVRQFL